MVGADMGASEKADGARPGRPSGLHARQRSPRSRPRRRRRRPFCRCVEEYIRRRLAVRDILRAENGVPEIARQAGDSEAEADSFGIGGGGDAAPGRGRLEEADQPGGRRAIRPRTRRACAATAAPARPAARNGPPPPRSGRKYRPLEPDAPGPQRGRGLDPISANIPDRRASTGLAVDQHAVAVEDHELAPAALTQISLTHFFAMGIDAALMLNSVTPSATNLAIIIGLAGRFAANADPDSRPRAPPRKSSPPLSAPPDDRPVELGDARIESIRRHHILRQVVRSDREKLDLGGELSAASAAAGVSAITPRSSSPCARPSRSARPDISRSSRLTARSPRHRRSSGSSLSGCRGRGAQ